MFYFKNRCKFCLFGLVFWACGTSKKIELEQYVINGEKLYIEHCSNCHGKNGEGFKQLYPPINHSDFLNNKSKVICIIKNGSLGGLVVNGIKYPQKMPKNELLYDLDIAQITTFIYTKWQQSDEITKAKEVSSYACVNQ